MTTAWWLTVIPFLIFLLLLLWLKVPLLWTSLITLSIIVGLQLGYWQILPTYMLNSWTKGLLVAGDILVIILGAIFFLETLKSLHVLDNVSYQLQTFFKDYRVQVILLAWFLENFIEGTAGFGTPAVIVAPILVSLGVPALTAVVLGLLGNSTSVIFGAAGTPIRIGFEGLNQTSVPLYSALFNSVGLLVPVFMLWTITSLSKGYKNHFWEALPFAIWSGVAFVVPSILLIPLGQEFPSILGSVIGLGLVLLTTRLKLFLPKHQRPLEVAVVPKVLLPKIKMIFPYALLIVLLILGKFLLGSLPLKFPWGFKYQLNLFNPGVIFIISGLVTAIYWGQKKFLRENFKKAWSRTWEPFLVIASMSIMVQLLVNSGSNSSGNPSALEAVALGFRTLALPFLAPFIGAFGSFITGSATVSNLMFGHFLNSASQIMHLNSAKILALELVGAGAGNMIALADILAAEAVVGLKNQTREVLKRTIIPCLIYLTLVGLVGLLAVLVFR